MLTKLQLNWQSLLREFGVNKTVAKQVFFDLVKLYSSPDRYYHNLEHIHQVLETVEILRSQAKNIAVIQLAAWFHDVIYNSKAKDNEEKSAEYAEVILGNLALPQPIISSTKKLILKTKNHQTLENDIDSQILLDADMAILGADECEYQRYTQAIKQEYSWLSETEYQAGRTYFLQQVLQREKIFLTEMMLTRLEIKARKNIQAEIIDLSKYSRSQIS